MPGLFEPLPAEVVDVDTDREKGVNVLHRTLTLDMSDDHGLAIGSGPAKITKVKSAVVAPTGERALVALDVANGRNRPFGAGADPAIHRPLRRHHPIFQTVRRRFREVLWVEASRSRPDLNFQARIGFDFIYDIDLEHINGLAKTGILRERFVDRQPPLS
jgi:hypothetical protein